MSSPLIRYRDQFPDIAVDAFIAPSASIIGSVTVGAGSNIWFNVVMRGDVAPIRVGCLTNIQDGTTVHVTTGGPGTKIGDRITIGHMALLHGCVLEDDCFVGMGSIVMDDAVVESRAMVAAGAMVTPGKRVPSGQLWAGRPARFLRELTEEDYKVMREGPLAYAEHGAEYRALFAAAGRSEF